MHLVLQFPGTHRLGMSCPTLPTVKPKTEFRFLLQLQKFLCTLLLTMLRILSSTVCVTVHIAHCTGSYSIIDTNLSMDWEVPGLPESLSGYAQPDM